MQSKKPDLRAHLVSTLCNTKPDCFNSIRSSFGSLLSAFTHLRLGSFGTVKNENLKR